MESGISPLVACSDLYTKTSALVQVYTQQAHIHTTHVHTTHTILHTYTHTQQKLNVPQNNPE